MNTEPSALKLIEADTEHLGFAMASDRQVGTLLKTLAASKPGGRFLELGTGTGLSAAWILDGADADAHLLTVDNDEACVAVAQRHLSEDLRIHFRIGDGASVLRELAGQQYDLIFADTWPGKFWDVELALDLLAPGGFYLIDDLHPQPNWPEGHGEKVADLLKYLGEQAELAICQMDYATGLVLATRQGCAYSFGSGLT